MTILRNTIQAIKCALGFHDWQCARWEGGLCPDCDRPMITDRQCQACGKYEGLDHMHPTAAGPVCVWRDAERESMDWAGSVMGMECAG